MKYRPSPTNSLLANANADGDGEAADFYQFWNADIGFDNFVFWTPTESHRSSVTANNAETASVASAAEFAPAANTLPTVSISDHTVAAYTSYTQVANWISYSDANGDAATWYQFWDSGTAATSAHFWTVSGGYQNANTVISVQASAINDIWVGGGTTGSETMWVRAFDGQDWSNWDSFTLTTVPNTAPVATINDHSVVIGRFAQVVPWISYSDANGDAATWYQFWDSGTAATSARFWTVNGGFQDANTTITLSAADVGSLWVGGGSAVGSETLWVRAFDGHDWGNWDSFTLTVATNTAPVATIADQSVAAYNFAQVGYWISWSDINGDVPTEYQFWDGGTGANSARFWTESGGYQSASTLITVNAADLFHIWVGGGINGSETMWVRAFDGETWGNWDSFNLTTVPNTAPVATISDHSLVTGRFAQPGYWISWSDANGDVPTEYQFWDGGTGANSARFWTESGGYQNASTSITVNAADLFHIWVGGATAAGTETMYVRAFDGHDWGAWDSFNLTTVANTGPVATIPDQSLALGQFARPGYWISWSDVNGDVPTEYQFWDGGIGANSARFWTESGGYQNASTAITVNAADLFHIWVGGATGAGTETMYVRAFDGFNWGAWDPFVLTSHA